MDAEFPERVELVSVRVPLFQMPPPNLAVLPDRVELVTVTVEELMLKMPPPPFCAELPERVELEMERVALVLFQMPPPLLAVLPDRVELEMERVPALLNPPPLAEVFAPETVTPEMLRSPPEAMLKMLKLRPLTPLSPLMVSEEAPGPVMVMVPRATPEINWVASRI